jgi:hypothetical protein
VNSVSECCSQIVLNITSSTANECNDCSSGHASHKGGDAHNVRDSFSFSYIVFRFSHIQLPLILEYRGFD